MLRRTIRALCGAAAPLFFPTACFGCGRMLGRWAERGACPGCWGSIRQVGAGGCLLCALPATVATDLTGLAGGRCGRCLGRSSPLDAVRAAAVYDGFARTLVLRAKLTGRPELYESMGVRLALVARALPDSGDYDLVVGAPSHPARDLARGFDPGNQLARVVAREVGLSWSPGRLSRRLLPWGTAKRASRSRRRRLAGAIRARGPLDGRAVLVVDDVLTTGATLEACARALRAAGAGRVAALAWAVRLPGPPGSTKKAAGGGSPVDGPGG